MMFFFKNNLDEVHNCYWGFLTLFCDTCDILCIHYCTLIMFHDSASLLAAKVWSYSYFTYFHAWCVLLFDHLIGIHWFSYWHTCFTFISRDLIIRLREVLQSFVILCFTLFSKNLIIRLRGVLRLTIVPSQ